MTENAAADAIKPFTVLGQRIAEEAQKVGLRMIGYSIVPDPDGGPVHVRFAVMADESAEVTGGDDAVLSELEGMLAATAEEETKARAESQRAAAEEFLRGEQ